MLTRPLVGNTNRPAPPQRSFSGGPQYAQPQASRRPNLPSRLSSVRSASGPSSFVDLTGDGSTSRDGELWKRSMEQAGMGGAGGVVDLSDDAEEGRPRKRAKVEWSGEMADSPEDLEEDEEQNVDIAHRITPGEPLAPPPRPVVSQNPAGARKQRVTDPTRKSEGLIPPPMATRLPPPKLVADFSPWTGDHPEDVLSEQIIKAGYYDKPPGPSQNESNSARHSIWPNLSQKNNIGLQTLSHLFTQVLEKRQNLGRVTAPSSFKPPPRVTVTDTKREAWLKDLANTNIPLRRQSRTIPHGIRGKLLMEQCLAKSIPLRRAVWLAKCVGANELRAFRRKGVSGAAAAQGEAKWIRDWTVQVEQFMETIIRACGQDEWRRRIDYAIKLASAFYSEGLVDKDEYLGWIVSSFSSATVESLPLWTIIVQVYWRDLARCGRGGRRLARGILQHLHALTEKKHPVFEPLKQRLQKLITVLVTSERDCLVLPDIWEKCKDLLTAESLNTQEQDLRSELANITDRNERLAGPMRHASNGIQSPLLSLYAKLDSAELTTNWEELSAQCVSIMPDTNELVSALFDWASTPYRVGKTRIYVAARIIKTTHHAGHDTDGAILEYVQQRDYTAPTQIANVWVVIAELVRTQSFATGKYLQWLIASGAVSTSEEPSSATGLLSSLPVDELPQHVRNLRATLLRRLGRSEAESSQVEAVKAKIQDQMNAGYLAYQDDEGVLATMSVSARSSVGYWIKSIAQDMAKKLDFSLAAFCVLRNVLEEINDLPAIADVADGALSAGNASLLASVTDTVNMHALDLAILDCLPTLVDRLVDRHRTLRSQVPLERAFLVALAELVKRFPDRGATIALLDNDLLLYEQQHSAAICSPASDNLIGMQAGNLDNDEEIDAVFASGNSMDEQLMQRVFLRVIQRASGKVETPITALQSRVGRWLEQLRDVDSAGLERLTKQYVPAILQRNQRDTGGIAALVAARCLRMESVIPSAAQNVTPEVAATLLRLLASPLHKTGLSAVETYTFRLQQARFCAERPDQIAALLGRASEHPDFPVENAWTLELALSAFTSSSLKTGKEQVAGKTSVSAPKTSSRLCSALLSAGRPKQDHLDPGQVIRSADALNVPFCNGWLRAYLESKSSASNACESHIKDALLQAVADRSQVWPLLLSAAKHETLKSIHEWAREQLLAESMILGTDSQDAKARLITVLDATYSAVEHEDETHMIVALTERLKIIEAHSSQDADRPSPLTALPTLLHLCTLYSQPQTQTDACMHARAQLLAAMCALITQPYLQTQAGLTEYIHDVATLYADDLPDVTLASLARSLPAGDKRLLSLLPSISASSTTLALATRVPATPNASVQQQPLPQQQTQQQRALAQRQTALPQVAGRIPAPQSGQQQAVTSRPGIVGTARGQQGPVEWKQTPFTPRAWEVLPSATPVLGENDCFLGIGLFGGRKV